MAATVTVPDLEASSTIPDPADERQFIQTTTWRATLLSNGAPAPVTIVTTLADDTPLDQTGWDDVWTAVLAAYNSIYANAPVAPPANPIVI